MKTTGLTLFFIVFAVVLIFGSSCSPKYGCPSGAVGAEQLLSGEKVKKQKKFRGEIKKIQRGIGEHLFNQDPVERSIIRAAIFRTSK